MNFPIDVALSRDFRGRSVCAPAQRAADATAQCCCVSHPREVSESAHIIRDKTPLRQQPTYDVTQLESATMMNAECWQMNHWFIEFVSY